MADQSQKRRRECFRIAAKSVCDPRQLVAKLSGASATSDKLGDPGLSGAGEHQAGGEPQSSRAGGPSRRRHGIAPVTDQPVRPAHSGGQQRAIVLMHVEKILAGKPIFDGRAARAGNGRHRVAAEAARPGRFPQRDDAEADRGNAGLLVIGHPIIEELGGLFRVVGRFADAIFGIGGGVLGAGMQDPGVAAEAVEPFL